MNDPSPELVPGRATRPAVRAFFHMGSSKASSAALLLVAFAITAGALGPTGLGIYAFGVATVSLFRYVADFGFQDIVRRDVAQTPARERDFLSNLVYLRLVMGVATYGVMVGLVTAAGYSSDERRAVVITGVLLIVLAMEPARIPLELRLRMGWIAGVEALEAIALAAGSVVLAVTHHGPIAFLWLYVAANSLTVILLVPAAMRHVALRWRPQLRIVGSIGRVAWPIGLVNLVAIVYYGVDTLILAHFHSSADVGQYGAAYRLVTAIGVFAGVVISIVTPLLAWSSAEDRQVLQRRVARIGRFLLVFALPILIGGVMTSWRAFTKIPGFGSYHQAGIAFAILAPAASFIFLATLAQVVLIADHHERVLIGVSVLALTVELILCFTLILPYSLYGAAVATTITEGLSLAVSWWMLHRHVRVTLFDRAATRMLGPAIVLVLALFVGYLLPPLVQVAVGGIVYFVSLPLLGAITWHDLEGFGDPDGPVAVVPLVPEAAAAAAGLADRLSADRPVRLVLPPETPRPATVRPAIDVRVQSSSHLGAIRGELKGTRACRLVGEPAQLSPRLALAARLAGCPSVSVESWGRTERRRYGFRRWTWALFLDRRRDR